ncbi:MAG: hypothetical protein IPN15_04055 [Saprospiraceae bacterium]|nr:hypothetical protein [Candidatus Vicinibacter affinis]
MWRILQFNGTKISNITCHDNGTSISSDDKWSFDVFVPGNSGSIPQLDMAIIHLAQLNTQLM